MICVSVTEKEIAKIISVAHSAEMAEIRIDLCGLDEQSVTDVFSQISVPTIATCRPEFCDDEKRAKLLKTAILSGATYVDVEIESQENFKKEIMNFAHEKGSKCIVSYHNYEETPTKQTLQEIIDCCFSQGADIAKIATMARSKRDTSRVLSLYETNDNIVALAMGEEGKISRVACLYLGSPFSFAAIDETHASANGQLTVAQMKEIVRNIKK
ncbi:MAG: type I 3-dehydroquinate dehydratase [Bacteroidales bacterium]|nr:type I 3-dehydroquinate dehydratase [Bacteroidales bacterium]